MSKQEAISLALAFIEHNPDQAMLYKLDTPTVEEKPDAWLIYFDKITPARPSQGLVRVDKTSQAATRVSLR